MAAKDTQSRQVLERIEASEADVLRKHLHSQGEPQGRVDSRVLDAECADIHARFQSEPR